MFEEIRTLTIPAERRRAIEAELDRGYTLSDVITLHDRQASTEALEVINGIVVEGGHPRQESAIRRTETFTLRTVSGEPLGPVRLGMDPTKSWTSREQRSHAMLGETADLIRTYGARFQVGAEVGAHLLRQYGYGIARPRYFRRSALNREEKDASGRRVTPTDRWLLVEEGSRFEAAAEAAGDLKPLASAVPQADGAARKKAG
jgi:hypothetical protein